MPGKIYIGLFVNGSNFFISARGTEDSEGFGVPSPDQQSTDAE